VIATPRLLALLVPLLLAACASPVPRALREAPPEPVSLAEARSQPAALRGREVRWGGTLVAVHNLPERTRLEIVARPLDREGRPRPVDRSPGRFLAEVAGFLDPAVYAEGRDITVRGRLAGVVHGRIGQHPYDYPLVRVEVHYLFPPRRRVAPEPWPAWYDDPFFPYPWYPHPPPWFWW